MEINYDCFEYILLIINLSKQYEMEQVVSVKTGLHYKGPALVSVISTGEINFLFLKLLRNLGADKMA